ncbi:MAG: alpha/beta fold hydrolase [Algisphaera sp.]
MGEGAVRSGGGLYAVGIMGLLLLFGMAYALLLAVIVAGVVWQMNCPRRKTLGAALGMGGAGDPADLGLNAQVATFNLSDGSTSPGWVIEGDNASGPVAVVVHGHRDSRFGSLYRAEMLAPYVSRAVVFDLPGHGDATARRCLMGKREAADVLAVVAGLPEDWQAGGVVLMGYSMGATIVVKAAGLWPDRFAGVIAAAPYRFWDEGLRGQLARRKIPRFPAVMLAGWLLRAVPGLAERPGFDRAQDAAQYPGPLLVLHGDADDTCPLSAGQAIAQAAPQGTLVVIAGGTHNQLLAADAQAVHGALQVFFEEVPSRCREASNQNLEKH